MTPGFDLSKLSHAEKDALILSLAAQLQTALGGIAGAAEDAGQFQPAAVDRREREVSPGLSGYL